MGLIAAPPAATEPPSGVSQEPGATAPLRVVAVEERGRGDADVGLRDALTRELRLSGYGVVGVADEPSAVLRVEHTEGGITMELVARDGRPLGTRRLEREGLTPQTASLAAVDLLDATADWTPTGVGAEDGVEPVRPPAEPKDSRPEPGPAPAPAPARPGAKTEPGPANGPFDLRFGLGFLWPVRHRSPGAVVSVGFDGWPHHRVALGPYALLAISPIRGSYGNSTVDAYPLSMGGRLGVELLPPDSPARFTLQGMALATAIVLRVNAGRGFEGQPSTTWYSVNGGGARFRWQFRRAHVGVRTEVLVPINGPVWTALPEPQNPRNRDTVLDLRGAWMTAVIEAGARW